MYESEEFLREHLDPILQGRHDVPKTDPHRSTKKPVTRRDFIAYDKATDNTLDPEQRAFVDDIMRCAETWKPGIPDLAEYVPTDHLHNLCGDGGTGKSYAYNVKYYNVITSSYYFAL
jgi:hypothetical protein